MSEAAPAELNQEALLRLAATSAYTLYSACLTALPSPWVKRTRDLLCRVLPGHWVLEISLVWDESRLLDRLGQLVSITWEPMWEAEEGETDVPTEAVWYIRTLDGRHYRWTNAAFIRVLGSMDEYREIERQEAINRLSGVELAAKWCWDDSRAAMPPVPNSETDEE